MITGEDNGTIVKLEACTGGIVVAVITQESGKAVIEVIDEASICMHIQGLRHGQEEVACC